MPHRFVVLVIVALTLLLARRAGAQERPHSTVGLYGEGFTGVRTVTVENIALQPAASRDAPSQLHVDGRAISPAVTGVLGVGGGLAVGPLLFGVDLGMGLGGNARGPIVPAGDIAVKPSGFVALVWADAYVGVMLESRRARYRLDAVLGEELVGLGMERPGYPDTRVTAVNGTRWTFGPRARVDFLRTEGGSLGVALGTDVRSPLNATLMLVVTSM